MGLLVFVAGWVVFWVLVIWGCFKMTHGNGSNY